DPHAQAAVAARYGEGYVFSPSQFESYLSCPFQFFLKYVLGLAPVDDRDDFDEDFIARGNRLHKLLEELERRVKQDGGDRLELSEFVIQTEMEAELTIGSDTDAGLYLIERRRVKKTLQKYVDQMRRYDANPKWPRATPSRFEVAFGGPDGEA